MKEQTRIGDAVRWAIDTSVNPAMAAADWLARDIDPSGATAVELLTAVSTKLSTIRQAKDAFKTMRIVGETSRDRCLGARLYAAAIAAGLVRYGERITRQSDAALHRAFKALVDDTTMPPPLRELASRGIRALYDAPREAAFNPEAPGEQRPRAMAEAASREPAPHLEIERKFLLDRMPALPPGATAVRIEQGYLPERARGGSAPGGITEGRLRRRIDADGVVRCLHTIKRGTGMVRTEVEREITAEEFDRTWPRTEGRRLRKTRHLVRAGAGAAPLTWEIDHFEEIDLVLAEVELPAPDARVEIPSWLAPRVVREVTGEPEYRNYALATRRPRDRA